MISWKPIEEVRTATARSRVPNTITFYESERGGKSYIRLTVSADIAKKIGDMPFEILESDTGLFAIKPDSIGRYRLSKGTITGGTTATFRRVKDKLKDNIKNGKLPVAEYDGMFVFPAFKGGLV